jgi:A/G-specific adenine glycosylase
VTDLVSLPIPAAGARRRRPSRLQGAILAWYEREGRSIAFRGTQDPWAVLVSEVMAQQTQVARVEPAWRAFMERFPEPASLARATPADVLRAWQGLGYNRRAIALQRAARAIVGDHDGRVPADLAALEALPGIGPYTARAILAIAFGKPVGAVDVNVRRVLTRLDGSGSPGRRATRELQATADALVPVGRVADWTHALMDLGALVCRPEPRCEACPVRPWCATGGRRSDRRGLEPDRAMRRRPAGRFETTSRWLRGRIVRDLAAAPEGAWTVVAGPIGDHGAVAVATALDALARDGVVEVTRDGRARLPSQASAGG